jgi:hypothetical protein
VSALREEEEWLTTTFSVYIHVDGTTKELVGVYLICDGGYHRWRCLQCPMKHSVDPHVNAFSAQMEAVRKDVECFFGILKIRFRYIDGKIEITLFEDIDNVMYTCCILHNMLLKHDGYADKWKDLEGGDPDGEFDDLYDNPDHLETIAARALAKTRAAKPGNDDETVQVEVDVFEVEHEEDWPALHDALVTHHMIAKERKEIKWLK